MKILFWTETFWPRIGGVEILSRELLDGLGKRNHRFMIVTSKETDRQPNQERFNGMDIRRFPFQQVLAHRGLTDLKDLISEVAALKQSFRPDLIHIHTSQPSLFFHHHTREAWPAPVLFTVHEPPVSPAGGNHSLIRRVLGSADWVTAVSGYTLCQARRLAPEITARSSVILNGLSMPTLQPTPLPFSPPCLLCIGRLIPEKGLDLALEAFARVHERIPRSRLLFAGDGPEKDPLKRRTDAMGLSSAVRFEGWVSPEKIPFLMNQASMALVPSRWEEPFGLVALQAAQMGRPVVAAHTGGLPEIVVHQKTGLLFEKENTAELTEFIFYILDNPRTAAEMGRTARERARECFSLERMVNAYNDLYSILANSDPAGKGGPL